LYYFPLSEFQNAENPPQSDAQVIENKQIKRHSELLLEGASDVPAAGKNPGQPKEQQDPGKSNRQRSGPQKGNRPGSLQKARWK
jgi:hypothetical protein